MLTPGFRTRNFCIPAGDSNPLLLPAFTVTHPTSLIYTRTSGITYLTMSVLHQSIEFAKAFHEISTIREGILSALSSYKRALGSDVYELHPNMGILLNVLWLRPLYQKSEQWDTAERFYVLLESEKRNIEILVHTKCLPFLRALKHNLELDMPTVNIFNADNEWKSKTFWKEFCEDTTRKLQWHLGGAVIISGCEALENLADMMSKPPFGDARGGVISGRNVQFGLRHIDLVRLRIEGIGNSMMGLRKVRKWMDLSHTDNPLLLGTGACRSPRALHSIPANIYEPVGSGKTMFAYVTELSGIRRWTLNSRSLGLSWLIVYFNSGNPMITESRMPTLTLTHLFLMTTAVNLMLLMHIMIITTLKLLIS